MKNSGKPIVSPFLKNKDAIKDSAVRSLRNSFEIEGIYFADDKVRSMVSKVRSTNTFRK